LKGRPSGWPFCFMIFVHKCVFLAELISRLGGKPTLTVRIRNSSSGRRFG
jgi:hypothetical protein